MNGSLKLFLLLGIVEIAKNFYQEKENADHGYSHGALDQREKICRSERLCTTVATFLLMSKWLFFTVSLDMKLLKMSFL